MIDGDKTGPSGDHKEEGKTKPAGQDVGPPEERVDDEVGSDEGKTMRRQE